MTFKIIKKTTSESTTFFARRKWLCFWVAVETFSHSGETIEVDFSSKEEAMEAITKYVAKKSLGTVYDEEIIEC